MTSWEERMSQRAKAREVAAKERREIEWRRSLADQWADQYKLTLRHVVALPGETRLDWSPDDPSGWEHAGHLTHACGQVIMCSCGTPDGGESSPGCGVCSQRRIGRYKRSGIHLHGTLTCCPCGAEDGITCVAFDEDYINNLPTECDRCGKPVEQWGDLKPYKLGVHHELGCPLHPETTRCDACGEVIGPGIMVGTARGWFHAHCDR